MKSLTPRQARFVAEYSAVPIAAVAALRAGYSPTSARNGGAVLLRNPAVAAALDEAGERTLAETGLRAERILAEAMRVAFADIAEVLDGDGGLRPLASIGAEALAGFAAIDVTETPGPDGARLIAVRRFNKLAALKLLARHAGLLDGAGETPAETEAGDDGDDDGGGGGRDTRDLMPRQIRFVAEYVIDFNATRAARVAGYSARQAQRHGSRLLKQKVMRQAIERSSAALVERMGVDPARVLREIGRIAFADPRPLCGADGRMKRLGDVDPDTLAALRSLRIRERGGGRHVTAQLFNKLPALRLLFRHFGLS